jgi:hypothetical protein
MAYKFEKLRVWQRSLDYVDALYEIAEQLPSRKNTTWRVNSREPPAASR